MILDKWESCAKSRSQFSDGEKVMMAFSRGIGIPGIAMLIL